MLRRPFVVELLHISTRRRLMRPNSSSSSLLSRDQSPLPLSPFVPRHSAPDPADVARLVRLVAESRRLFVVTGAGVSTESGISDYRSEGVGLYARSRNRPIKYQEFVNSEPKRRRYWARNFVGWRRFRSHEPNATHRVLADWENRGRLSWLVTQNVDSLHAKAGSQRVTELHGSARRVVCIGCDAVVDRDDFQETLSAANPRFDAAVVSEAPDGDAELSDDRVADFAVPPCARCGSLLKPDIVFFGDNVPLDRKEFCSERLRESDAMLVVGSSLDVFSGYRFVLSANEWNIPLGILNIGETRADKTKVDVRARVWGLCSEVLLGIDETL